jgi:UDP-N-acetylmuramate dehydrogenase
VEQLLEIFQSRDVPWFILGQGSNLLVADQGVRGAVLQLAPHFAGLEEKARRKNQRLLEVGAGYPLSNLVRYGLKHHLQGLEFLTGIPGSLGGAWAMNAGSHGREIKDITEYVIMVAPAAGLEKMNREDLVFTYRRLNLEAGAVILSGGVTLSEGDPLRIREETQALWKRRRLTQPLRMPSCGSVFKNPPGDFAGRLIEEAGLKGVIRGDAEISSRHANFIINRGKGRAHHVLSLMRLIQKRVFQESGILLEPEVTLWGCSL